MVVHDHLANMLNHIVNSKGAGKVSCSFAPYNKLMLEVIEIMKASGYVKDYGAKPNIKGGVLTLEIGRLNFCKAIKPRFNVKKDGYNKFVRRFLPSRQIGIIIVSTSKGLLTHQDAGERKLGGKLIAYCY